MTQPLVALMQPCAGRAAPWRDAVKAFLRPTRRGINRLELEQGTTSTPRTFNMLWSSVLNLASEHPITHVAMIHDDIAPDSQLPIYDWLDVLMDELAATGADMISAVVPIKDGHGVTSTAVDNDDDPWIVRRLTMAEVCGCLPETFTAKDVPWNKHGGCLLPNTGLWLAKFDWHWAEQVKFHFINTIRHKNGVWHSVDIAEDWDFGRQMHSLGLDVRCTRKVTLAHGEPRYHNRSAWGDWPTDLAWLEYQKLGLPTLAGWRFPDDVTGWLSRQEGIALADLAKDKVVLEIGAYCGRSTVCMAQTAAKVFAVDTFDGRATTSPRCTLPDFMESLVRYGVTGKVTIYQGVSWAVVPTIPEKVDVAFIDGAHAADAVLHDAEVARQVLKPDGLLAFHDYGRPGDQGVTAAVNRLLAEGAEMLALHDTVAILRPAA